MTITRGREGKLAPPLTSLLLHLLHFLPDDTPPCGFPSLSPYLCPQDDVVCVVPRPLPAAVAELDHVGPRQQRTRRPLGHLVLVVLGLKGEHGATLGLDLLAPVLRGGVQWGGGGSTCR